MLIESPTIELFETTDSYSYLWLKYIDGFELQNHCAKCLLGHYSNIFEYGKKVQYVADRKLDEFTSKLNLYYLCGVTRPYKWVNNLHVAFRYKKGSIIDYTFNKTHVRIKDAEQINIKQLDYRGVLHGNESAYNTCRNWRFAFQMTHEYGK